jgi:hypothetical protein
MKLLKIFFNLVVKRNKMKFKISNGQLTVKSESGNTYTITRTSCSCAGFGWRGNCKHFNEAKKKGLIDKLLKVKGFSSFSKTPFIIESRKDAIRQWLKKKHIKIRESIVNKIESIMTEKTSMKEILACVKN